MTCSENRRHTVHDQQQIAHRRRIQAAWFDYLAATQDVMGRRYPAIENEAWSRLQRRLARNDERLAAATSRDQPAPART